MGVYLKLHMEKGIHGRFRPLVVFAHRCLGVLVPVIGYTQIVLVCYIYLEFFSNIAFALTFQSRVLLPSSVFVTVVCILKTCHTSMAIFQLMCSIACYRGDRSMFSTLHYGLFIRRLRHHSVDITTCRRSMVTQTQEKSRMV
jgi:hypothetical protein